jgi:hypothetical protein
MLTSHRHRDGLPYPESYPLDNKQRGQDQPRYQNDFRPYMATGVIVTINARVATKEPTPVAEDVSAGEQIDDQKQRSGDSQRRKSGGINECNHNNSFKVVADS